MSEMSEDYDFERCNGLDGKMPLGNDTHWILEFLI
jgi:hypothetical protein